MPSYRAGIKVKRVAHTYTLLAPPKRELPKVRKIKEMVSGYRNINTGMAAEIMVVKPKRAMIKETAEKMITHNL